MPTPDIISGTSTLFRMSTPPVGWTKNTTYNDHTLRVVSGSASSGGSLNFSSIFINNSISAPATVSGSIGGTVLTGLQIPRHTHTYNLGTTNNATVGAPASGTVATTLGPAWNVTSNFHLNPGPAGYNFPHTHPSGDVSFNWSTSSTLNIAVRYVDVIVATRN